ncbi:hypothetical protein L210DRAFT_3650308 [Boletus edulis BED1]|uniref:Uncharacterized protein n=1 Tax=Boletus edulis BED1 TaxID=1328754 RepID=A0AAD4GA76_BOLED|nr:hypothetical protein L210DRAFT_3650308 [Boletus edulis BED1]
MASPTPSSENGKTDQSFSLSLTIYSHVKKGKGKTKEEKTTKMKELVFGVCTSTANYLSFLRNVLLKHNLRDSNISEACNYPFKYLLPKQRISDAIDVDDAADYNEMVKKIIEEKPSIVRVLVNKHKIEKALRAKHTRSGSDDLHEIIIVLSPDSKPKIPDQPTAGKF